MRLGSKVNKKTEIVELTVGGRPEFTFDSFDEFLEARHNLPLKFIHVSATAKNKIELIRSKG